ncbi:hypothetical protein ACFV3R_25205 [Streptomyces sp. NPDC059740]|uniref:hypothetical protein n=1 Tax=Streptomyces sp. NPDC059740 TaxID=3346926 RepID=UPI0036553F86
MTATGTPNPYDADLLAAVESSFIGLTEDDLAMDLMDNAADLDAAFWALSFFARDLGFTVEEEL